jgi:hypothetical protein
MSDLYIYYKVRDGHADELELRVRMMQANWDWRPACTAKLKRRPEAKDGMQTWMECYLATGTGFDAALAAAERDAAIGIDCRRTPYRSFYGCKLMCLIVFAWQVVPGAPLIAAANRDEYYDRPASAAVHGQNTPRCTPAATCKAAAAGWASPRRAERAKVRRHDQYPRPSRAPHRRALARRAGGRLPGRRRSMRPITSPASPAQRSL